jgi:type IV pilus assembly protein PilP
VKSLHLRALALLVMAGAIGACSGSGERRTANAAPKPAPVPVADAAPDEPVMDQAFRYDPVGKTDPFKSFVRTQVSVRAGSTSPLERFDLSQLEVTGIVWNAERPRALVHDPTGKGYVVSEGASMGKNQGRVIRIDDNRVIVKETYVDFRDQASSKDVELHLYERHGG